jgi:hypothetical protein
LRRHSNASALVLTRLGMIFSLAAAQSIVGWCTIGNPLDKHAVGC